MLFIGCLEDVFFPLSGKRIESDLAHSYWHQDDSLVSAFFVKGPAQSSFKTGVQTFQALAVNPCGWQAFPSLLTSGPQITPIQRATLLRVYLNFQPVLLVYRFFGSVPERESTSNIRSLKKELIFALSSFEIVFCLILATHIALNSNSGLISPWKLLKKNAMRLLCHLNSCFCSASQL